MGAFSRFVNARNNMCDVESLALARFHILANIVTEWERHRIHS